MHRFRYMYIIEYNFIMNYHKKVLSWILVLGRSVLSLWQIVIFSNDYVLFDTECIKLLAVLNNIHLHVWNKGLIIIFSSVTKPMFYFSLQNMVWLLNCASGHRVWLLIKKHFTQILCFSNMTVIKSINERSTCWTLGWSSSTGVLRTCAETWRQKNVWR